MGMTRAMSRPIHCGTRVERSGEELLLRWRRPGLLVLGVISLAWLIGWTVACVNLTKQVVHQPSMVGLLLPALFWAGWVLVAGTAIDAFLGSRWLRIGADGVEYHLRVGVPLRARRVPLDEIRGIGGERRVGARGEVRTEHAVKLETAGKPIVFALGIDTQEQLWLTELIQRQLEALRPDRLIPVSIEETADEAILSESLKPSALAPEPPRDCRFGLEHHGDGAEFTLHGKFSRSDLAAITFANLVFDLTTGLAFGQLTRHFQWDLFFFLIPFAFIVLALIVVWWVTLLAPYRRRTWGVRGGELHARDSLLGVGRTQRIEIWRIEQIEIRKREMRPPAQALPCTVETARASSVAFVGHGAADLLVIDDLTDAEARWIGGVLRGLVPEIPTAGSLSSFTTQPLWDHDLDARPSRWPG